MSGRQGKVVPAQIEGWLASPRFVLEPGRASPPTSECDTLLIKGPVLAETMKERILDIQNLHLLQQTAQHFSEHQQQAYLVGGSLRNILLGEACVDWDIVTDGDVPMLARQLADKLGGHYVHMHDKASRVVVKHENEETIIDISPLMGNTIEDDLRARDFTINAMAVALAGAWHPQAGYPQGVPLHFSTPPRP